MVICNICKRIQVRFKNGTSNLKSHLERHKIRISAPSHQSDKVAEQQKRLQQKTEDGAHIKNVDPQWLLERCSSVERKIYIGKHQS